MTKKPARPAAPTHDEQEATILHLRSQVTLLEAKLAAKRRKERAKVVAKPATKRPIKNTSNTLGEKLAAHNRQVKKIRSSDVGKDGCYKRGTPGHLAGVRAAAGLLSGGAIDRAPMAKKVRAALAEANLAELESLHG